MLDAKPGWVKAGMKVERHQGEPALSQELKRRVRSEGRSWKRW